ncbi:MAG: SDR family NAD(P)-dependent oxidoreductase [Sporomusa sp.]
MELKLSGKIALVTGASSGVGRSIALALAQEGVKVVIGHCRDGQNAQAVVNDIKKIGSDGTAVDADIANAEQCRLLYEQAGQAFGNVDILINNAGIWPTNWISDIPLAEWDKTIDVNLTAVFLLSQLFIKEKLERKKGGKILNITSQAAFYGSTTGHAHYAASKAGVVAFTVSAAREVAAHNINVNAIALGIVETNMIKNALTAQPDYYAKRIPIGRVAQPEDIAKIAVFMVSDAAAYITGATIDATGGMLMR